MVKKKVPAPSTLDVECTMGKAARDGELRIFVFLRGATVGRPHFFLFCVGGAS